MSDQPPVLTPSIAPPPRAIVGRIGRAFAILALAALALIMVYKPG